jgi:hypothetical protein
LPRCVEAAFLKWTGRSPEDVALTICFTLLLGGFAWSAWTHPKRIYHRLDEIFEKIETLEHAVRIFITLLYAFQPVADELHLVVAFYFSPSDDS